MLPTTKHERIQCWIALLLTVGEFSVAIFLVFNEGHIFALYLAITYAVRETSGGKHYHEVLLEQWARVRDWRKHEVKNDRT